VSEPDHKLVDNEEPATTAMHVDVILLAQSPPLDAEEVKEVELVQTEGVVVLTKCSTLKKSQTSLVNRLLVCSIILPMVSKSWKSSFLGNIGQSASIQSSNVILGNCYLP
jgi:hypothetical protein